MNASREIDAHVPSHEKSPAFKTKRAILLALLGLSLVGCGFVENQAQAAIAAAGITSEIADDPELIQRAMNGASADELRDYARQLERRAEFDQDLATLPPSQVEAFSPEEVIPLTEKAPGIYSFTADRTIDITSDNFVEKMKTYFGEGQFFISVMNDLTGRMEIFPGIYDGSSGYFCAYLGDEVLLALTREELTNYFNSHDMIYNEKPIK